MSVAVQGMECTCHGNNVLKCRKEEQHETEGWPTCMSYMRQTIQLLHAWEVSLVQVPEGTAAVPRQGGWQTCMRYWLQFLMAATTSRRAS